MARPALHSLSPGCISASFKLILSASALGGIYNSRSSASDAAPLKVVKYTTQVFIARNIYLLDSPSAAARKDAVRSSICCSEYIFHFKWNIKRSVFDIYSLLICG
jgi:hypothetical protein